MSFWISFISFVAPTKVLSLSERIFEGRPCSAMKRFRLGMRVVVSRFGKTSRYKAFVRLQA